MASSDPYRRVGRGGAGNFLSKEQVEHASKAPPEDLEAQRHHPPPPTTAETSPPPAHSAPAYARAGRGGAGNFHEPAATAEALDQERARAAAAHAAHPSHAKHRSILTGRGGMGNWADDAAHRRAAEEEERRKEEEMEAKIRNDVEAGLKPPPRTYHLHNRDVA